MRILMVSHGYPPRETAGTERHVEAIANALARRGHVAHVAAATRAPGRRQYARLTEAGVDRIVTNVVARAAGQRERDPAIDAWARELCAAFRPDVVHVHHLQFLSSGLRFDVPTVYTLHDGWTWCAAGGLELLPDGSACPGASPARCGPCGAAWAPVPGRAARALIGAAGAAARWLPPERLHAAYQRLPGPLRARVHRDRMPPASVDDAEARNRAMADFAARATLTAPSRYLAERAQRHGLGPVEVIRHGIDPPPALQGGAPADRAAGPLLFLGTIAHHKGPDLVVEAWRRLPADGRPPLRLHGPVQDASLSRGHTIGPVLDRAGVFAALRTARALVLGSRWGENAPLVILEARLAGCPVIAPRIGGIPEILTPGVDGFLYDPDDVGALVDALRKLLASPTLEPSPPRTLDAQVDDYLSLYATAVG